MKGSLRDLIKVRRHAFNLGILVLIWMVTAFNLFLITFQLKYIEGDFFTNTIVSSLAEIPA